MSDIKVTYFKDNMCILDHTHTYFDVIRNEFSYDNPAARFSRNSQLPSRLHSISRKGYCYVGMLWRIKKFLKAQNMGISLDISPRVKEIMIKPIKAEVALVPNKKYVIRDYQLESVKNGMKIGGGICLVGTGGGKSLIIATMLQTIFKNVNPNFKALLVVPNLSLVNQMYNDFKNYECEFSYSKWSGKNNLNSDVNVIIVNTGYLQSSSTRYEEFKEVFMQQEYLFYDEVHLFGNEPEPKATKLLKQCNFKNVFGFTGSLSENTYQTDNVYGYFGPNFYIKSSKSLRDEKYISNIDVNIVTLNHVYDHENLYKKDDKELTEIDLYNIEIDYITLSKFRNSAIKRICKGLNGNTLILVDRIIQGEILLRTLGELEGKRVFFIHGGMPVDERQSIQDEMEKSNDIICIAISKIFSTGISINNIKYGIFYYIGKAWNKTIQSIGRGLRLHESKEKFILFDICDNLVFSSKHKESRKNIYEHQKIPYKEFSINE